MLNPAHPTATAASAGRSIILRRMGSVTPPPAAGNCSGAAPRSRRRRHPKSPLNEQHEDELPAEEQPTVEPLAPEEPADRNPSTPRLPSRQKCNNDLGTCKLVQESREQNCTAQLDTPVIRARYTRDAPAHSAQSELVSTNGPFPRVTCRTVDDRSSSQVSGSRMINYTESLTLLMQDIVARVPTLSFIDIADVLVFARFGRSNAEGAFATCHCLSLPPSEPGYYFWRDRESGRITRRSEWFVTKSPVVTIGTRQMKYLMSFALPRFCDQSLDRSRKERFYPERRAVDGQARHRRPRAVSHRSGAHRHPADRARGRRPISANCHSTRFFEQVAEMVQTYLALAAGSGGLRFSPPRFPTLERRHGGVVGTSFRTFPSFPQRYIERLATQLPCEAGCRRCRDRAAARRAAADALHRGRSAHPPVLQARVAPARPQGQFRAA